MGDSGTSWPISTSTAPDSSSSASSSLTWMVALAIWHFGQVELKWEREAADARAAREAGGT